MSSPVSHEEILEYISQEEGVVRDRLEPVEFVRTGRVPDTSWWIGEFTNAKGEVSFVSVHTRAGKIYLGTSGASSEFTSDQVLIWEFGRMLETLQSRLVRDGERWRIAHRNEEAAARAALLGLRPESTS